VNLVLVGFRTQEALMEVLLTASEFGRVIGRSPSWIHLLRRTGRISPVARTARGVRLYSQADAERIRLEQESRSQEPTGR
jgi:DNA-binding transcriptional MerR regulator